MRLVPKFNDKDTEIFFLCLNGWSDSTRILLLQCVLTGKAQQAFSALNATDCVVYHKIKSAVLKAYELVPEAYRQRLRGWKCGDMSHLEFMRDLCTHFDSWCSSTGVDTFKGLQELIILEQFKNCVGAHCDIHW